ncbi:MAG: TetR/AcrR family transcriptional regulator [Rhizobiales bacterium]|nr:TetR/AcrR family transcriptional regulator [Hyphomicrobiales bacterium]
MNRKTQIKKTRLETTQEKRHLILLAAIDCFLQKGFHQTSMRDIAKKSGSSLGNIYNHFKSKDVLITEIATLEAGELDDIIRLLEGERSASLILQDFIDVYLKLVSKRENILLTAEITTEGLRNKSIGKGFVANRVKLTKALSGLIDKGLQSKEFTLNIDKKEVSHLILDLIEGLAMRTAFAGGRISPKAKKALKALIEKTIMAA